jgi:hypothetical protein
MPGSAPDPAPPTHFLARCWRGGVDAPTLLWRHMLLRGTAINLLASLAALALAASGLPLVWAALLHLAPLPWNLFLFAAFWRRRGQRRLSTAVALGWLLLMLVL